MTKLLMAVTGSDHWTLSDGTKHPCGYWPEELATPYRVFSEAGFDITIATPGGVRPSPDQMGFTPEMNGGSAEAGEAIRSYLDSIAPQLDATVVLEGLTPSDFDAVFIPGGHGPMEDLAVSASFGEQLGAFLQQDKPIGTMCHGPAALLAARDADGSWLFDGYTMTSFTLVEEQQVGLADKAPWNLEPRLRDEGAKFENAEPWHQHVVSDRNLHTGQNPASSHAVATRVVQALTTATSSR